jgi:hypothetical protein
MVLLVKNTLKYIFFNFNIVTKKISKSLRSTELYLTIPISQKYPNLCL